MLPKFFKGVHLQDLDAAEYEEAPAITYNISFEVSCYNRYLISLLLLNDFFWIFPCYTTNRLLTSWDLHQNRILVGL